MGIAYASADAIRIAVSFTYTIYMKHRR
jgi:hypothetical protein